MPAGEGRVRVVVCAKQAPDPETPPRLDPVSFRLERGAGVVLDDADAAGIEVGLRLGGEASAGGGHEIVLVSMAPGGEAAGVRKGLALGASSAVVVSDPALAGADALTTARVLAAAVLHRVGPTDVVIAGTVSVDGYTGVLASQLAELLGLPALTFARKVRLVGAGAGAALVAERETEDGHVDVECPLPCVLSVMTGSVALRYPSYKAIVDARRKPVEVVGLAELGLAPPAVAQEVVSVVVADARAAGEIVDDDGHGHERILDLLVRLKVC